MNPKCKPQVAPLPPSPAGLVSQPCAESCLRPARLTGASAPWMDFPLGQSLGTQTSGHRALTAWFLHGLAFGVPTAHPGPSQSFNHMQVQGQVEGEMWGKDTSLGNLGTTAGKLFYFSNGIHSKIPMLLTQVLIYIEDAQEGSSKGCWVSELLPSAPRPSGPPGNFKHTREQPLCSK